MTKHTFISIPSATLALGVVLLLQIDLKAQAVAGAEKYSFYQSIACASSTTTSVASIAAGGAGTEGRGDKTIDLERIAGGSDGCQWKLDSRLNTFGHSGMHHFAWQSCIPNTLGRTIDGESPFLVADGKSRHILYEAISEYGGSALDIWRLTLPAVDLGSSGNGAWHEEFTDTLINSSVSLRDVRKYDLVCRFGGIIDTAGHKAVRVYWKATSNTVEGNELWPNGTSSEYNLDADEGGLSYFSLDDRILLCSRSSMNVRLREINGLIDATFRGSSLITRSGLANTVPAPAVVPDRPAPAWLAKVSVGSSVPPFSFGSLDDPGSVINNGTFAHKYYLIDFWATWCIPCIEDLPWLDSAYAEFGSRGFDILSVSVDASPSHVGRFRSKPAHTMPWKNTILPDKMSDPFFQAFGYDAIPVPVLVDDTGKIIAMGNDKLYGHGLLEELRRVFAEKR